MIKVQNLTKMFGSKVAVDNITFSVERGEVLGFLGPNGAGKSTTMRMVTGFIPPTAGAIQVGSFNMLDEPIQAKQLLGYLPENAPLYTDMTVYGFLLFTAELRGFRGDARKQAVHRVIEACFLEPVVHQNIDTLSKGYRHRTCFAQAIIHDPDILIMDEPTDGLDPNQKHEVRGLIRRMGVRKAIIFSTHILEEVEAACTKAIIIDQGRIVANGTPQELKQKSDLASAVTVRVNGVGTPEIKEKLGQVPAVKKTVILQEGSGSVAARVFPQPNATNGELARGVFELAAQARWKIEELHTEEGRLDDVFRNITLSETTQDSQK